MSAAALIVLAKAPVPGRSKTRLCPPCVPGEAAQLAEAALVDTLEAVRKTPAARRVLVLDGDAGDWLPAGFEVLAQSAGGLDRRLGAAFEAVGGPGLLIGMDTPQVTPALLGRSLAALDQPGQDAVIGPAHDGGYWAIGLRDGGAAGFDGVPMSTPWTAQHQRRRLARLGLRWIELSPLRDVDTFDDAVAVARMAPWTRFAARLDGLHEARHARPNELREASHAAAAPPAAPGGR